MKKIYVLSFVILFITFNKLNAQGGTCATAEPFCTAVGTPYVYQNVYDGNTGASGTPSLGCLYSTPRPSWFYIKSLTAGAMTYSLSQSTTIGGTPNIDVDFIAFGPYSSSQFSVACTLLTGSCSGDHNCTGNITDCSYSSASTETMTLNPTSAGQYFLIMITNYEGTSGYISFTQTGGSGSDCSITCPSDNFTMDGSLASSGTAQPSGSTVNCSQPFFIDPPQLGGLSYNPITDQLTPCVQVSFEPFRTNLGTNGTVRVYENGTNYWSACPTCTAPQAPIGGSTATNGSNFGWYLGQVNPIYSHPAVFCRTGAIGTNTTMVTLKNCWDNSVLAGPQLWNSTTCFTLTSAASPTAYGSASFSIAPATGSVGLVDLNYGSAYVNPANLPAGTTYTVTYSFNNGVCGMLHGYYIFTVPTTPVITAISSQTVCSGSTVAATNFTITPSAGATVSWINNNTVIGIAATGTTNIGSYTAPTLTATAVGSFTASSVLNGCIGSPQTFSITINPTPTITLSSSPTSSICLNGSLTFTSTGANTYTWSASANGGLASTSGTNVGATPTSTGTASYTVNATSAAGCTNTATQTITVNALPNVTITPATSGTLCSGTSITLTGSGASGYTWQAPVGGGLTGSGTTVTITPTSSPLTYTAIGTAANTCTNSAVKTITVSATPTISVSNPSASQSSTLCSGNSVVLTATGAGTFSWSPATGLSATTGNTVTASPTNTTTPTIYTVTGTSAAGCISPASSQGTFTVTVNSTPTITLSSSPTSSICLNGSLTFTSTGANTYTWSASANGGLASTSGANVGATPTSTGTASYTVNATSAAGCTNTATKNITVNALPNVTITPATSGTLCSGTSITLTGSGASGYTWQAPVGGGLTGSGTTVTITPTSSPLTYTAIGTAANTCTNSAVKTITVSATPTISVSNPSASQSSTLCSGNSVVLTATGAGTFSWSPATGLSATTGNTVTASPTNTTTPTIYTVTGTSAAGCISPASSQGTFTVTVNSTPTITALSSKSVCAGATVPALFFTVIPSGGTLNWTNTNISTGLAANGSGTTIAAFTASNVSTTTTGIITATATINGCNANFSHTLTVNPLPIVTASPASQTITCSVPTVTLTGSSNPASATPVWAGGVSTGVNSYTATASSSNVYTLTATSLAGCPGSATVQVVPSAGVPTASASITNSLNCIVTSAQVIATTTASPVSYSWTGPPSGITSGAGSSAATVNTGGQYTVVVTNTLSLCSTTITVPVPFSTVAITPTISATGSITCSTPTLVLTGNPASGVTYTWTGTGLTTSPSAQTVGINSGGVFTLSVTSNSNGCVGSQTISISTNTTAPTVSLTPTSSYTTTCAAPTVTFNAVSTPSASATYSWTAPSTGALNSYTISNPIASGSGIFTVAVTNTVNGCSIPSASQATVQITADAGIPVVSLSSPNATITCANQTPSVSASTTSTPVSYSWTPTAGIVPGTETSQNPSFNAPGSYSVVVTNTNSGCASSASQNVVTVTLDNTLPLVTGISASNGATLTCINTSVTATPTITPNSNLSYTWTTGPGIINPNQADASFTAPGVYTLVVTNTVTGCVSSATNSASTFTVYQNTVTPTVAATSISSNSVIGCSNSTVTFTTNVTSSGGNLTYNWSTGVTTPTISITSAGIYSVIVTDAVNGCSVTTQFTVTGNTTPPQNVNAGANANIACGSSTLSLTGITTSTNVSMTWTGPSSTSIVSGSNTATPVVTETGTYTLTVTDNLTGCQSTSTVSVSQSNVTAAFTADPTAGISPLTVNFTNGSTGATNYTWNFGNSNTSNLPNPSNVFTNGSYTVMLTTSSGSCTATATLVIVVEDGLSLEIPNVFTPNNDGTNDLFTIKSTGVKEISLQIFNRWGEKLYEFTGVKAAWDGLTPHGIKVPDATYFYFVKATGFDNKQVEKQGTVNLFR